MKLFHVCAWCCGSTNVVDIMLNCIIIATVLLWTTGVDVVEAAADDTINNVAHRDDTYYPIGLMNPLASSSLSSSNNMYWRDSYNVLHDLSLFQSLSIQYHSCV